ncbi:LacI family DNA-binding transcriptional regulator [Streptomyces sp. TP-A0874]|uniref:LacI family DNA-binding transcriptional regulator n=1 Tax=Streptomyces sp. TP-A0874 TaxID=549819 RepID=UPI000853BB2C|nr:substrate-binding domain-containing protein [Streptomyces sp. TP-A0874]
MTRPTEDPRGPGASGARLAEVAAAAGVHQSTASRALRGAPGVGADTCERVREAARLLGYMAHPAAASLRTGRSRLLGVLVPRLTDIVLATVYEGIESGATAAGYQAVVANTGDDPAVQRRKVERLLALRVDGLLLGDARLDAPIAADLLAQGVPTVLVSRRLPRVPSYTCDDLAGGRMVAEHLLALGHRRVGVVAGEPHASTGVERTRGFLRAFAAAGAPVDPALIVNSAFDARGGELAGHHLLTVRPRPTAIFAVNDFAAIGVMGALRVSGLVPGEDLAVAGFNDVPLSAQLPIPLTSVRSPMREMGERAATALVRVVEGGTARSRRLTPRLVVRASTAGTGR